MTDQSATALAHPNIAFIKYWGNRDSALRIPLNGSISMNLDGLETRTRVHFEDGRRIDSFTLNGRPREGSELARVASFLDNVRRWAGRSVFAHVDSTNNFPAGAGIASSAAAFAALALSASRAIGLELDERDLSRLARLGSGSASRSIPPGFVEWLPGESDQDSYAVSIAPPNHWDLVDIVVVVDREHKRVGSTAGHNLAPTSPLNRDRVIGAPMRLRECREAILSRDFGCLARVVEYDSELMHAVMETSNPPLRYQTELTREILTNVINWRHAGHALCSTVDAGPNVHVIAEADEVAWAVAALRDIPGVLELLVARPGGGAELVALA